MSGLLKNVQKLKKEKLFELEKEIKSKYINNIQSLEEQYKKFKKEYKDQKAALEERYSSSISFSYNFNKQNVVEHYKRTKLTQKLEESFDNLVTGDKRKEIIIKSLKELPTLKDQDREGSVIYVNEDEDTVRAILSQELENLKHLKKYRVEKTDTLRGGFIAETNRNYIDATLDTMKKEVVSKAEEEILAQVKNS